MNKHTPGPWQISKGINGEFEITNNKEEGVIAFVPLQDEDGVEGMANANLMSAAPEMFESLVWLYKQIENLEGSISLIGMNLCQDAILKASGVVFQKEGGQQK